MTKEDAQKKFADWAKINENILMFVKEVKDAFHFIYLKNNLYFKIAIAKTDERFYSITSSLTKEEIDQYDRNKLSKLSEMEKEVKQTKVGVNYFEVTLHEMITKLSGLGICDSCSTPMTNGYLVPVLNYVQCDKCFSNSIVQTENYKEDMEYEKHKTMLYKQALEK